MNNNIIDQFELLLKQIQFDIDFSSGKQQTVHTYRFKSIANVIKILKKISFKITKASELENISGIGDRSIERIEEILKTGKLAEIKISPDIDKYLKIIEELDDVIGIGRKKAYELFKEHNIKSIKDLKTKYKNGKIDLPDNIVKGLKYMGKIHDNIPRTEIDSMVNILFKTALKIDSQLFITVCGSYRRETPTSGDIDVIIVHPSVKSLNDIKSVNYINLFVEALKKKKFIIDSLTEDDVYTKYMGICKLENGLLRRIDIRYMPYNSYYSAILYFTGSKDFNRKMRQIAITMGYKLNEYGLFDKNGKQFQVESEKDIFDLLGMEYVVPSLR
jgi:DNA polymerase beta